MTCSSFGILSISLGCSGYKGNAMSKEDQRRKVSSGCVDLS